MTKAWQLICDVSREGKVINIICKEAIIVANKLKSLNFIYRIQEGVCSIKYQYKRKRRIFLSKAYGTVS